MPSVYGRGGYSVKECLAGLPGIRSLQDRKKVWRPVEKIFRMCLNTGPDARKPQLGELGPSARQENHLPVSGYRLETVHRDTRLSGEERNLVNPGAKGTIRGLEGED